ncbi:hypothetical protein ANCDUO_26359 [Ancylostoma duodenale]|uniref:Uncharacterized protein n=1 Tax=Ancylostoma duodenale TaxID=51022 RepID=A0A0C2F514_9BILA|nr:hypothetical protein ANCDUO_26359 [Ancylostoma duodenale]
MPGPACTTGSCAGGGYAPPPVPAGPPGGYAPPPVPAGPPPPMPGPGCATGTCGGGYGGVMAAKAPGAGLVPNDVPEQPLQLNAKQNT